MTLLDVGCGPGTLTVDLAARVAPGAVVGLDIAGAVLEEAGAHARERHIDKVAFVQGDIRTARLDPARFDVVHAHQVLQFGRSPQAPPGAARCPKVRQRLSRRRGDAKGRSQSRPDRPWK